MKKITAILTTAVIMATALVPCMGNTSTASYSLKYAQGAPGNVNVLVQDKTLTSSGKDCITIKSTKFKATILGASADAYAEFNKNKSKTQVINRAGVTYTIDYPGNTQPKVGVSVNVHIELSDYVPSHGVTAQGTISL